MTWRDVRLSWVASTIVPQRDKPEDLSGPIPWLRIEDFDGKFLSRSKSGQGVSAEAVASMPLRVFPAGTVVCSCSCTMGATAIASVPLITNQTFIGLVPGPEITPDFLYYLLQAMQEELQQKSSGSIQQYLSKDEFKALRFSLPPMEEQRRIADFLDDQVGRIDQAMELREQQILMLEELAASRAESLVWSGGQSEDLVAGPIGPTVWTPSDWKMVRNGNIWRERVELSSDGSEELLSVSHLTGVTPRSEKSVNMFLAESFEGYKKVESGDLVINTMWAWMGALGISKVEGIVSPAYGVYRATNQALDADYFDALYRSRSYVTEMTRFSKGVWSSRLRLYPEAFLSLKSPLPKLEQQRRIGSQIEATRSHAASRVTAIEQVIKLLDERKRSLITAAVTGQLDVTSSSPLIGPWISAGHSASIETPHESVGISL